MILFFYLSPSLALIFYFLEKRRPRITVMFNAPHKTVEDLYPKSMENHKTQTPRKKMGKSVREQLRDDIAASNGSV